MIFAMHPEHQRRRAGHRHMIAGRCAMPDARCVHQKAFAGIDQSSKDGLAPARVRLRAIGALAAALADIETSFRRGEDAMAFECADMGPRNENGSPVAAQEARIKAAGAARIGAGTMHGIGSDKALRRTGGADRSGAFVSRLNDGPPLTGRRVAALGGSGHRGQL